MPIYIINILRISTYSLMIVLFLSIPLLAEALEHVEGLNTQAIAGEHIEVTRDIVLSGVTSVVGPAISQSSNMDGYIVTGSIGGAQAWATRLDAQGQQKWSYTIQKDVPPDDSPVRFRWHNSEYKSAIVLKDGSTILCGYKNVGEDNRPVISGLLTHIDNSGNLLSHQLLYPQSNQFQLNYLYQSAPWNDGFVITGLSIRNKESFVWLMALNAQGNLLWEKLLPRATNIAQKTPLIIMKNGDLVITNPVRTLNGKSTGMDYFTDVTRIKPDGEIRVSRRLSGELQLVRQPNPAYAIRLVPLGFNDSGMQLLTLNDDLSDAEHLVSTTKNGLGIRQALELPDHSIVLVGATYSNRGTALMIRMSPDLRQHQDYTYQPVRNSGQVDDGLATGKEGEWVTIREVVEHEAKFSSVFSFVNVVGH